MAPRPTPMECWFVRLAQPPASQGLVIQSVWAPEKECRTETLTC